MISQPDVRDATLRSALVTPSHRRRLVAAGSLALAAGLLASPSMAQGDYASAATSKLSMKVYREKVKAIGTAGGVTVTGDGFGSAVVPVPGKKNQVYGLTDRGPNVDGPDGSKIEPFPKFTPAIGRFRLSNGRAELLETIPLRAKNGHRYNGQVNSDASTGEVITGLDGVALPASPYGYDSEGLVALKDGTFWVSDEYGPFITHFSRHGRAIERLSPFDGTLPAELSLRTANRGMEGLTITPDGKTLVGIMQSALTQADSTVKPKSVAVTRIVTVNLRTRATHEYAYVLDDPAENETAASEIAALSATQFVIDERDGEFNPGAYKKLWKIDISKATDLGPLTKINTYDGAAGGLKIAGKSVEAIAGGGDQSATTAALQTAGITPVSKGLYLDLGALVSAASPDGTFFAHDKVEGLAIVNGGRRLIISNDSDFGLAGSTGDQAPFSLVAKVQPDGQPDHGEFLIIDRH